MKSCFSHVLGVTSASSGVKNQAKRLLVDSSEERINEIMEWMHFLHEVTDDRHREHQVHKIQDKLAARNEMPFLNYLNAHILHRRWSRCDGPAGQTTAQCGHERLHRTLKSQHFFNSVEGMGNALHRASVVGEQLWSIQVRVRVC